MVTERAELRVSPGTEEAFEAAMQQIALPILKAADGVESIRFGRGVERHDRYLIIVEWTSLDHHARFPQVPRYGEFRAAFAHSIGRSMEHFMLQSV